MRCDGFPAEVYGFFALGTLSGAESDEVANHLRLGCEVCGLELKKSRALWDAVALATPRLEPSRSLRGRILRLVAPPAPWWRSAPVFVSGGLVALAAASGWVAASRRYSVPGVRTVTVQVADTSAIERLEQENRALSARLEQAARTSRAPAAPTPRAPDLSADLAAAQAREQALARYLAQERQRATALEGELTQQRAAVSQAQTTARDANQRYQEAIRENAASAESLTRLAALAARTQELEREVAQYRVLLENQRRRLDQNLQLANLVSDPSLRLLRLRGTEKRQRIEGHAFLTGDSRVVFYASQLPPLPPNRVYQLWLLRGRAPAVVSAGVFQPDANQRAVVQFADSALVSGLTTLAVTDEPPGGSAQPTGHKWMVGF